jgi:zinc transporter
MIILRGVNLNENAEAEDMVSIRLWIDDRRIISIQRRPLKAVEDINERFDYGKGPRNSGEFIAMLIGRLLDRMEPVFSELDDRLDNIEEKAMKDPQSNEQREITSIRRQAIMFRRYIAPKRDAIARLRSIDQPWMESIHNRRLQETLDQVIRYTENLDAIRERAQIVKDELASTLANRMNKNIYALSVVAAIFLPLGFLTGLLGINIGGIPGSENNQAFAIFCGLLVGVVALQIVIFKKMKWF